jgi:hypothetical protein
MVSSGVQLEIIRAAALEPSLANGGDVVTKDQEWAEKLGRRLPVVAEQPQSGAEIVRISREMNYNAIVVPAPSESWKFGGDNPDDWLSYVLKNSPCGVFIAVHPAIPREVVG